jgi:hypothetical protein
LSIKTNVDNLSVVWPQNHWDNFLWFGLKTGGDGFLRFGLKIGGDGFSGLASKPVATVSWLSLKTKVVEDFWFGPLNRQLRFYDLDLKITVTIS